MIRLPRLLISAAFALLAAESSRAVDWQPLPTAPEPRLDNDAPAEALFHIIGIDDGRFPYERQVHDYVRYRIYDPERAVELTRVALPQVAFNGDEMTDKVKLDARLILPNGTIHLFGKKDIRERTDLNISKSGGFLGLFADGSIDYKERFLAVTGIEPGSVLEIQFSYEEDWPSKLETIQFQQKLAPIRDLQFNYQATTEGYWNFRQFFLNRSAVHCETSSDPKTRTITIHGTNVPALVDEPYSGPAISYAATFVASYESQRLQLNSRAVDEDFKLDPTRYPWSPYATAMYLIDRDHNHPTHSLRVQTEAITAGAQTDEDKARRIHDWVQKLYRRYATWNDNSGIRRTDRGTDSPDDVIHFEDHRNVRIYPSDFAMLDQMMNETAGLETDIALLPNRSVSGPFNPGIVAWDLLPDWVDRVKIGDTWRFSDPTSNSFLSFGDVRWQCESQVGLLAKPNQTFVPVTPAGAKASLDDLIGTYTLSADGTLDGTGIRRMTGHVAEAVRAGLIDQDDATRDERCREPIEQLLRGATIKVTDIANSDDPYKPMQIKFSVHWPGFAEVTKSRLIFHPGLYHFQQPAPLGTTERHYNIQFPYCHYDRDRAIIQLPAGFALRPVTAPDPLDASVITYKTSVTADSASNRLHYARDYSCSLLTVRAGRAADLRGAYDQIATGDQLEAVAERKGAARAVDSGDAP